MLHAILPLALVCIVATAATSVSAAPAYRLAATLPLGEPDRWDYLVSDAPRDRIYVAHGDRLAVVDPSTAKLIGEVRGIAGGTHGIAISAATGQGFTDDGRAGRVVAFDLKTLATTKAIPAAEDADAIAADPVTGHIFVVEGDPGTISVVDPRTDDVVTTINAGEKMEYIVADGSGRIFVAGEEKSELLEIDARSARIIARWPTPGCTSPHGLAYDRAGKRLFMGCVNSAMMVVDATDGRVVATLPIGLGSDAVAFDAVRRRVFSSNGKDGSISIYRQATPDHYELLETLSTAASGRTMAVDAKTGRLFVAAADTQPDPTPGVRPHVLPGTLRLLVFAPID